MQDNETPGATADEKLEHQLRTWRRFDKAAIKNPCDRTKRAEYHARQKLRATADKLEEKDGTG